MNKSLKIILSIVGVAIVALGAAYYFFIMMPKQSSPSAQSTPSMSEQDKKELARLEGLIATEKNKEKKVAYLYDHGDLYINSGEYDKALESAKEIESLKPNSQSAGALAEIYMQMEDYTNAVKYYQIAADRTEKPASPTANSPYNDYMNMKKEAEAKL